jgi:hypothetical protein
MALPKTAAPCRPVSGDIDTIGVVFEQQLSSNQIKLAVATLPTLHPLRAESVGPKSDASLRQKQQTPLFEPRTGASSHLGSAPPLPGWS